MRFLCLLLFATSLWATPPGFMSQPIPGLIAYWPFMEGSGLVANDLSGFNSPMVLSNAPAWSNGIVGNAVDFNGTTQSAVAQSVAYNSSIITISCFFKANRYLASDTFLYESSPNANNLTAAFYLDFAAADVRVFLNGVTGDAARRLVSFAKPTTNVWHHMAVVFDNSTTNGLIVPYVDGVLQATTPVFENKNYAGNIPTTQLFLVSRANASLFSYVDIDDFRIYNRALTQEEVLMLYNGGYGFQR